MDGQPKNIIIRGVTLGLLGSDLMNSEYIKTETLMPKFRLNSLC